MPMRRLSPTTSTLRSANLGLRFILELCALVAPDSTAPVALRIVVEVAVFSAAMLF